MNSRLLTGVAGCVLACVAGAATVDVTREGVKNDGTGCQSEALRKIVREAPAGTVLKFPKGVYHLDEEVFFAGKTNLVFRGEAGAVLELKFSTTGGPGASACGLVARDCAKITVEGFRVTTDVPPNCAGRVVAKDEAAHTFDVKLGKEFPCTGEEHFWGIDTCDEEGMPDYVIETYEQIKEEKVPDGNGGTKTKYTGTNYKKIGDHLIRVQMPEHWDLARLTIGHRILFRYIIYGRSVFDFVGCDDTVFRNVLIDRCASMGLTVGPPSRNVTLDHFDMLLNPKSEALYVANADGVHLYGLSGKLEMTNCHFKGLGDDALNIHCGAGEVKTFDPVTGDIVCIGREHNRAHSEVRLPRSWASKGDELIVYDGKTMLTKGRIKLAEYDSRKGVGRAAKGWSDAKPGDNLANAKHFPAVHVANCTFENSRARGILLQSHNMLVENCLFRGHALPGIIIAADYIYWNEAGPTINTEVRNCRFEKCGMNRSPANLGAVQIKTSHDHVLTPHPAGVHKDVRLYNNTFEGCGNSGIFVQSTDGVKVSGNTFKNNSVARYDENNPANLYDIRLFNCSNIKVGKNTSDRAKDKVVLISNGVARGADDCTSQLQRAVDQLKEGGILELEKGEYHLYAEPAAKVKGLRISNHEHKEDRNVFVDFTGAKNLTVRGHGARFIFHGLGLGFLLKDTKNVKIENVSLDWARPIVSEAIIESFGEKSTVVKMDPKLFPYHVEKRNGKNVLVLDHEGWSDTPAGGMLFRAKTHEIVEGTGDVRVPEEVEVLGEGRFRLLGVDYSKNGAGAKPGDLVAIRPHGRPCPAVVLNGAVDTVFEDMVIHTSHGMGLIAQRSENVTWRGTREAKARRAGVFPPKGSGRVVTLNADASHFSNVKGKVVVENCFFETMMDDSINVHSTSLCITNITGRTLRCRYMHHESVGFTVFAPGERLRFIKAATLENGPEVPVAKVVQAPGGDVNLVDVTLAGDVPAGYAPGDSVECADYQCAVEFRGNIVRNNRARGTLFTTPHPVLVENNLFDHVSGCAILLEGDAAYWYESGACEDLTLRGNTFRNCLTSRYGRGIITSSPPVKDLKSQKKRYHRNIKIVDNTFETFDVPIIWARSIDGLLFKDNRIIRNNAYKGWGEKPFQFEYCDHIDIQSEEAK